MDTYKEKLVRKLKAKCSEVNAEFSEVQILFEQAVPLFCSSVSEYCKDKSIKNPLDDLSTDTEKKSAPLSSNVKSLYRKIAIKTHPDKITNTEDSVKLYQDATEAKKENKLDKMVSIAKDLKIDIYNFDFADINSIELAISERESEIEKIRSSYPWVWFFSSSQKRSDIIARFIKNKV